jgi:hypothetical protein
MGDCSKDQIPQEETRFVVITTKSNLTPTRSKAVVGDLQQEVEKGGGEIIEEGDGGEGSLFIVTLVEASSTA